jgi:hypothetical protein
MQNKTEIDIVKSFGDWTTFCHSYGLKPHDNDDNIEAIRLLHRMADEEILARKLAQTLSQQQAGRR